MNTIKNILYLVAICVSLQIAATRVEAKAVDLLKEVATKSADSVAAQAAEVEKTGGVRQTFLHTGVDMVLEKGIDVLGTKYPALKAAAPIAKNFALPMIQKAHSKINDMFSRNKTSTTPATSGEADTTDKPEGEKEDEKKEEKKEDEKKKE